MNKALTWPGGTPRSTGNDFDLAPREVAPLTPEEAKAAAHRKINLECYHRKTAMEKATRVNPKGCFISPTPQSDRDKTAKITGRRISARSQ